MEAEIHSDLVDHPLGMVVRVCHEFLTNTSEQIAVILPSFVILYLRYYLVKENKRRDALEAQGKVTDGGVVEETTDEGVKVAHTVDNNQLDLTDRENLTL